MGPRSLLVLLAAPKAVEITQDWLYRT